MSVKAFDKVRHHEDTKMLEALEIDGKDMLLISNLYWEQMAGMRIKGEMSE